MGAFSWACYGVFMGRNTSVTDMQQLMINYATSKRELTCSTHQAAILLLFQDRDEWSFADMQRVLSMSREYLGLCVGPLCAVPGKFRFLLRTGTGQQIEPTEIFRFNAQLLDDKPPRRITLPPVAGVSSKE